MIDVGAFTPKERLISILHRQQADRPPVICTGGMMNAAIVDVMNSTGHTLPEAHFDPLLMAGLAADVHEATGFENLGIPFCLTVEAEVLGSRINFGTLACEPKIAGEAFPSAAQVEFKELDELLSSGRIQSVARAGSLLAAQYPAIPVIGNITGPISTTASIVDPMQFFKDLRKDQASAHTALAYVSDFLCAYARLLLDHGVALISIGDPTATGEILGPRSFEEFAVLYLNKIIDSVHAAGGLVIVHICGNINSVKHLVPSIRSDALSTDAVVNLKQLKQEFPQLTTMGNLSTYLLQFSTPEKIAGQAVRLVGDGVDIISPACGLSTSTPLANICAMTAAVKRMRGRSARSVYTAGAVVPERQTEGRPL
jgi:[methyl-Co(III) methanol-specific corrinoid protein]:coenzyme M methyltransferase